MKFLRDNFFSIFGIAGTLIGVYVTVSVSIASQQKDIDSINNDKLPAVEYKIAEEQKQREKDTLYLMTELKNHKQFIIDNCRAQDVYDYEFSNHECGYTGNDAAALEIVANYFPGAEITRFPRRLMEDC